MRKTTCFVDRFNLFCSPKQVVLILALIHGQRESFSCDFVANAIYDVYQNSPATNGGAISINMPVFLFCWEIFTVLCGGWLVAGGIWLSAARSQSRGLL